jgi:hypothetical protein
MPRYCTQSKSRAELGESLIPEGDRFVHERLAGIVCWRDHNYLGSLHPTCPKLGRRDVRKCQSKRDYDYRGTH